MSNPAGAAALDKPSAAALHHGEGAATNKEVGEAIVAAAQALGAALWRAIVASSTHIPRGWRGIPFCSRRRGGWGCCIRSS